MKEEKIKSAAIRCNNKIYTGKRHCEIFQQGKKGEFCDAEQGFITDDGKFVTRQEAGKIAFDCGQIKFQNNHLLSEDIL